uniref:Putative 18s rrna sequence n=1 Tax=Ixodes ricinus TaxID=34613 RepID=A0A0K8R4A0_IXORI
MPICVAFQFLWDERLALGSWTNFSLVFHYAVNDCKASSEFHIFLLAGASNGSVILCRLLTSPPQFVCVYMSQSLVIHKAHFVVYSIIYWSSPCRQCLQSCVVQLALLRLLQPYHKR